MYTSFSNLGFSLSATLRRWWSPYIQSAFSFGLYTSHHSFWPCFSLFPITLHFNATATFLFPLSISVGYSWVPQRIVPGLISFSCSFPFHSVTAEHFNTIALLQKLFQLINGPPELHYSLHEISEHTSSNSSRKQYIWFKYFYCWYELMKYQS